MNMEDPQSDPNLQSFNASTTADNASPIHSSPLVKLQFRTQLLIAHVDVPTPKAIQIIPNELGQIGLKDIAG